MWFAIQGLAIGFLIAAPVGPIGVLCIRRTLSDGRTVGFLSGLGAATADMSYGAIAAFGLTAIQNILVAQQVWLRLLGGLFLVYLGVRTFVMRPDATTAAAATAQGALSAYLSTLGLTLTNPATILSFTFIFAGLRLAGTSGNFLSTTMLVLGIFLGSALWWLTLSGLVAFFRKRFTPIWMLWVNRLAGAVILGFGVAALALK